MYISHYEYQIIEPFKYKLPSGVTLIVKQCDSSAAIYCKERRLGFINFVGNYRIGLAQAENLETIQVKLMAIYYFN